MKSISLDSKTHHHNIFRHTRRLIENKKRMNLNIQEIFKTWKPFLSIL